MEQRRKHLNFKDRTGEKHITKQGYEIEIVEYFATSNCTIKFKGQEELFYNKRYGKIRNGNIINPYHPCVHNEFFIGVGKYSTTNNKKAYQVWYNMISRCYNENYHVKQPTYKECIVCEKWKCFQNFADWFEKNYKQGFHIDKAILIKDNKIYSPETCCFVPQEINNILTKRQNYRGNHIIGVRKHLNKYISTLYKTSTNIYLGIFSTKKRSF